MSDDLADLDKWVGALLDKLKPTQRRKLGMRLATELQTINARRIKANLTPDGSPMVPRKLRQLAAHDRESPRKLREARKKMFLRGGRFLRRHATQGEATVGYEGAIARVMRVHQLGLRDRVERRDGAPEATYPARQLLGITEGDRQRIETLIMETVTP